MNVGSVARSTSTTTASRRTFGHTEVNEASGCLMLCLVSLGALTAPSPSTIGGRAVEDERRVLVVGRMLGGSGIRPLVLASKDLRGAQSCSVITSPPPQGHVLTSSLVPPENSREKPEAVSHSESQGTNVAPAAPEPGDREKRAKCRPC